MRIVLTACTVFVLLAVVVACGDEDVASSAPDADAGTDGSVPGPTPTNTPASDSGATVLDANPSKPDTAAPVDAALGPSFSGDATYYDAHGQNACGISQLGD